MSESEVVPTFERVAWPLLTQRLSVRPVRTEDADAVFAYRRLPEVGSGLSTWTPDPQAWHDLVATEEFRTATLVVERDGEIVGDLYLRVRDAWAQREVRDRAVGCEAEIGWAFSPDHQGQGLATEAVRALISLCFADLGLRRLTAGCFVVNERSWRLMERVGMRREALSRQECLHRDLGWVDGLLYALLAEEWTG